jgi:predicted kinase
MKMHRPMLDLGYPSGVRQPEGLTGRRRRNGRFARENESVSVNQLVDEAVLMEAVLFVGLQGSGKSTFYRERYFATHVRINLDMLKTRHRESRFLQSCIETRQPFVVDNTSPTRAERQVYIEAAKQAGFRVIGYYFQSRVEDCKRRNEQRPVDQQIPLRGLLGTAGRLQIPSREEGFDGLFYVRIDEGNLFVIEEWKDEV